ncbi:MAG: DMT family transporter [Sandaracinaceae bacterium]|nr:DMT family transporter [Sandaracinaceae bacterium]
MSTPTDTPARPSLLSPGVRAMLWAALAFSVMSAMVKLAGSRIPSPEIAIFRGAITLVMSGIALRRAGLSPWGKDTRWLLVRGVLGCVGLHSYYYALTTLPLAEATVIQFLNPVLVAALAPFALGEKPGPRDVLGTLAGFAGVLLIARPTTLFGGNASDAPLSLSGVLVGLFGAFVSALVYLVVRKLKDEDARVVVFQLPLLVIPLTLPLAWPVWTWPTPFEWLVLLGVGIATQIGQVKMTESLQQETAARATAVSFAQVAFAMGWSVLFFHELPSLTTWLGAALVFAGTLLVARSPKKKA